MTTFTVIDRRSGASVYASPNYSDAAAFAAQDSSNYYVVSVPGPGEVRV